MALDFLMVVLAFSTLIGAMLTFKAAVNTGRKIGNIKELTEGKESKDGKPRKGKRGAERYFAPSQVS